MRALPLLPFFLIFGCTESPTRATGHIPVAVEQERPAVVAYLVRHAERLDGSADSPLSDAGRVRASALADVLRDVPIGHVHSTDTARTRATAGPTAGSKRLPVEIYDTLDPKAFARGIRDQGGHHLIVGHSDTLGTLVGAFRADDGDLPFSTYDRLVVIAVASDGKAQTSSLRYGLEPGLVP